jgi:cysteine dioxygenase
MLTEIIFELRTRPPSARSEIEMARLLSRAADVVQPAYLDLVRKPGDYSRTCAYLDERFEVLLLNWAPGARSALHDHGGQHCWMTVLDGHLFVDNYARLDDRTVGGHAVVAPRESMQLERGDLDVRQAAYDIHRVGTAGPGSAVSLHVYARPLRDFLVYDELEERCAPGRSYYDAVVAFAGEVQAG